MRDPYNTKVSLLTPGGKFFDFGMGEVHAIIKEGNQKLFEKIGKLRDDRLSNSERENIKSTLNKIFFNGTFSDDNALKEHSGLCMLTFANFSNKSALDECKSEVIAKPYIYLCYTSISGDSFTALARIPKTDGANHTKYFKALEKDLNNPHLMLDKCSVSNACLESYDPDLYLNVYCDEFDLEPLIQEDEDTFECDVVKPKQFNEDWRDEFTERIKNAVNSRKQIFTYEDAVKRCKGRTSEFDEVMIDYNAFLKSNPLENNDLFKYLNSYINGKKLNDKYFRHDLEVLNYYYNKADANPDYNPFHKDQYNAYVLYMMLKLSGNYTDELDKVFGVKRKDYREYNPLCNCPTHIRSEIPLKVKEYDISRAYPTFIFMELGIKPFDVYEVIDKKTFNMLLNVHSGTKGASIEKVREQLKPIYGDRVNEVITEKRFYNQGQMFLDLTKYEAQYIEKFIQANNLKTYVRLHDGIAVPHHVNCEVLEFGEVVFKEKNFAKLEIINDTVNFYELDKVGNVITNPYRYEKFLTQEGFIRVTQEGYDNFTILKNDNKILSAFNHKTDLVPFFKENINEYDTEAVENRIARDSTGAIIQSLQLLKPIPLEYHKDTKTRCDIPFKNGVVRITKDDIKIISYDEINGFFAKHETQAHNVSIVDADEVDTDFHLFLASACLGVNCIDKIEFTETEKNTLDAFYSMFGFLIHNYKNPTLNPAIVLTDEGADGLSRNGGRGKSLLLNALSKIRISKYKGGKDFNTGYNFVHDDLEREHDIFLLDDLPSGFNYDDLYTFITGNISAQKKGRTAVEIPFEETPKYVITTNWVFRYDEDAGSTNRRFVEYKFTDFWNEKNAPNHYFKDNFFTDWDEVQWNHFYNFCFRCVQLFLRDGLKRMEYDKNEDNFKAYFANDAMLDEMERIMLELNPRQSFNVTEFIEVHKNNHLYQYSGDRLFTIRNARKYIDAFLKYNYNEYEFNYKANIKKWIKEA